jgi:diguanylate cyclase (GGDEF)-like protein
MIRRHLSRNDKARPTLHRVWGATVLKLLSLMLAVGVIAVGAAQFQRAAMQKTTAGLDRTVGAQAALSSALLGVNAPPAIGMMYGTGNTVPAAQLRAGYDAIRAKIMAAFNAAQRVMTAASEKTILDHAWRTWLTMDAAILAAPNLVASGAEGQAMDKGVDLNKTSVWDRYNAISTDFTNLETLNVQALHQRAASQNRTQALVAPIVAGALLLGLLMSWFAIRRMRRDVLRPILALRGAAIALRESKLDYVVELDGATVELQDLAATLNDAAATLGATHRVLRDQAYTDTLTGLANRKALTEKLHDKLTEPGPHRLGVLFVDLDDFKEVNDTLGHAAGDELLTIVAQRLRSVVRNNEFVARLGGDEFAIVVDCADNQGESIVVAERVVAALNEPLQIGDTRATVSCSVGIATSEVGAGPGEAAELLRNADFAMYMAKSQGKNCFDVFAPSMHTDMLARIELKRDLSRAAQLDQLVLHYQPVVELSTGDVQGFEALVRWNHPTRGLLAPGEFIALAEDTHDIIEIGRWVVDRACRDLAAVRRDTVNGTALQMAINVSAHQITEPDFVDVVMAALTRYDIPAKAVTLEITEAVALTNTRVATLALDELRRHGLRVALDDFGVGFSSLRYLHELPIDIIKIDRSFVTDTDGEKDSMLRAIVTLGQSLGLAVVAEGIETPSELSRLRQFEEMAGQGYLLGRPMPLADATEFARSHSIAAERPESEATPSVAVAS